MCYMMCMCLSAQTRVRIFITNIPKQLFTNRRIHISRPDDVTRMFVTLRVVLFQAAQTSTDQLGTFSCFA